MPRVLVTGGAGFVGSNVAIALAREAEVVAFDSLRRRGSELNIPRLRAAGAEFVHGDVRDAADLAAAGPFEVLVECSAEPSVMAGAEGDAAFLVQTNLVGAYNCLELARRREAQLIFLSTSRVYPLDALRSLALREGETRLELEDDQPIEGASANGISERLPLAGTRTLYGATKLAAELLIDEYVAAFGLRGVVNRCGVIAGPWQMGRVDQGVVTLWALHHHFGVPLSYIGFGGKQVRDILHIADLVDLLRDQLARPDHWAGLTVNVGGGARCSASLLELTELCRELSGNEIPIENVDETRAGDVPLYISDCGLLYSQTDWRPSKDLRSVLDDTLRWIVNEERIVAPALGFAPKM